MSTAGTVSNEALLASVRFGLPRQSRGDKAEARKVEQNNSAKKGVATVSKCYFKEMNDNGEMLDGLAELKSHFGAWRSEHNRLTRCWDGGSTRLLVAALAPRYLDMTSEMEEATPAIVQQFITVAPQWKASAPERMGDLYSEADFPSIDEIRNAITYSKSIIPIPAKEQWKKITSITPDLATQMEQAATERMAKGLEEARLETWNDLIKPIQNIVTVLSSDRPKVFESLLGNLHEMLELAPQFNTLTGDNQLTEFVNITKQTLAGITVESLRKDPAIRQVTVDAAKLLLGQFGQASGRKFA